MFAGKNPILLGAVLVLSVAVIWLSVTQISLFARFGDLPELADRLDSGEAVSRTAITSVAADASRLPEANVCEGVFLKSGLTVLMASVDMIDRDTNYEAWSQAVERADTFVLHALGCVPTNGNFWLKLAMLRQAVGEEPNELAELLTNSQLYAPSEGSAIAGRYALYNRLTDRSLELIPDAMSMDIQVICSKSGDPIRGRLAVPSPSVFRVIENVSPQCSLSSGQS